MFVALYSLISIAFCAFLLYTGIRVFRKAGYPGWHSIIPIYGTVELCYIVKINPLILLTLLVGPVYTLVTSRVLAYRASKVFKLDKTTMIICVIFPSLVYYPIAYNDLVEYDPE